MPATPERPGLTCICVPKAAVKTTHVVVKFTGKQPSMAVMKAMRLSTGSKRSSKVCGPRPYRLLALRRLRGQRQIVTRNKGKKRTFTATQ